MENVTELTIKEAKQKLKDCEAEYKVLSALFNIEKDLNPAKDKNTDLNGKYVLIRSYDSGVHAGTLIKSEQVLSGRVIILKNSRRIWYWEGAASISELAMKGTSKPSKCKFPCEVDLIEVNKVCEVIECTAQAKKSISQVKEWSKQ